jgi:hypothetical protein
MLIRVFKGIEPAKSRTRLVFEKTILRKPDSLLVDPSLINKPDKPSRTVLPIKIGPARLSQHREKEAGVLL